MTYLNIYDEKAPKSDDGDKTQRQPNNYKYRFVKTVSMKKFISEFGEGFSPKVKERLLNLEMRSVLTRTDYANVLDIKHVEHTQYDCVQNSSKAAKKELIFGQFIALDGDLYFSNQCVENEKAMKAAIVDEIYNSISGSECIFNDSICAKKVDDENIGLIIDKMMTSFPDVSEKYLKILKEMLSYER